MGEHVRAARAAVEVLEQFGVRYAFTVPGESFLGMLDALRDSSIRLVTARHEGGAAFMTEAVGKLTGTPALCMATRAVGASNLAIGLHTAYQDSTPLIAIIGQVDTAFRYREAFQEIELAPFLAYLTKWSVDVPKGERLPALVAEGLRRAVSGRPGPVALAVRADIFDEQIPNAKYVVSARAIGAPRPSDIKATLDLLRRAARPLIIAGGGVLQSEATEDLVCLAERMSIPVITAFRRHDAFPNDHPLYLGSLSLGAPPVVPARVRAADVILALGTRLGEITTFGYRLPSPGAILIQVDSSPEALGQNYPASIAIAADVRETICALLRSASGFPDRSAVNRADRAAFEQATNPLSRPASESGVDPALVIAALQRLLPANAILTSDAGNFYGWLSRYYRFRQPRTYLGPTSGAMGYAVPAAIAAALVRQNSVPVVALAGDGGFLMTASELAVAAQLDLHLTCVIFNNAMYGTIHMHQERTYPGRPVGTELWSPDFVRYVEAFGGYGVRVDDNRDVEDGVRAVLAHSGISLLEVKVAPELISVERAAQLAGGEFVSVT
jgi:acetolactate synthase-1/2/3 large subunit